MACLTAVRGAGSDVIDVQVRLLTTISSAKSKPGEPVRVVTIAPLTANGRPYATAGCSLPGRIVEVRHATGLTGRESILLEFSSFVDARGVSHPINPALVEVDNARESVDKDGRILGLQPIKKPTSPEDILLSTARGSVIRIGALVASKLTGGTFLRKSATSRVLS